MAALESSKAVCGPESLEVACCLHALGQLLGAMSR